MRFGLGVCFAFLVVTVCPGQAPRKPILLAACADQRTSYAPTDTVDLTVTIENGGTTSFYIFRPLEWGWTGLWWGLSDAANNPVRLKHPVLAPLPPPPLRDKSELIELEPGYFYGRQLRLALSDYHLNAGKYFIWFRYGSSYHTEEGFGLPILTSDDGEIVANKIEISVR
jgi:hypothetical protein